MIRCTVVALLLLQTTTFPTVFSVKQQLSLSDSYLPVAMQVIAHLTDQMSFESKDESTKPSQQPTKPSKPMNDYTSTTGSRPTTSTSRPTWSTNRPTWSTNRPTLTTWSTSRPTSNWWTTYKPTTGGWPITYTTRKDQFTTPFHKPGLFAPEKPPSLVNGVYVRDQFVLLPMDNNAEYSVLMPQKPHVQDPLLSPENPGQIHPILDGEPPKEVLLPPQRLPISRSEDKQIEDEYSDENLQYLTADIREMLKLAHDPNDERVIDIWADEEGRKGPYPPDPKSKLSQSNLRLLLLYDLLSREAKRQKLSDYHGFSDSVLRELTESSSGGARQQLSFALSKMLDRKDCQHDYANNRAKEMVAELAKDETKLSSEIRYLQPLVYKL